MGLGAFTTFAQAAKQLAVCEAEMQRARGRRVTWLRSSFGTETHVDFTCFFLCTDCGYLHGAAGVCPSCGGAVLDLADRKAADVIRDLEDEERIQSEPWTRLAANVLGLLIGVITLWAGLRVIPEGWEAGGVVLALTAAFVVAAGAFAFVRVFVPGWLTWWYRRWNPRRPWRWRLPLPAEGGAEGRYQGPCEARGELLAAPFSGEACLGYRVAVLFDRPGDARPPEWMLDESEVSALSVAGEAVAAGAALFAGPYEVVDGQRDPRRIPQITRWLRARGVFPGDGSFTLYESLLRPGQEAILTRFGDARPVRLEPAA